MNALKKCEKFFNSANIAVYDGVDGLLDSIYKPNYAVISSYYENIENHKDDKIRYKAVEFNNGIIRIVATGDKENQNYGLLLGVMEDKLETGYFHHSVVEEVISYGENFKEKVFTNGVDQKSLNRYFKLINSKKERDALTDDEFDYLEENPYISLDILDLVMQDEKNTDQLITIFFTKLFKRYGNELFALGGNSGHFDKDPESVRKIFSAFFKDIKDKYIPMIQL